MLIGSNLKDSTKRPRRDHLQLQQSEAAWEETEVTSRHATEAELETLGYKGPIVVTQIIRTALRADGTPIGKTLTLQGGSTVLVVHRSPHDVEDEEAAYAASDEPAPVPHGPVSRPVRTYIVGVEGSPQSNGTG
ncbi:hypothetical protein ACFC3O_29320 [Streptomyces sp. NPDC056007]|uniref:hypothetical protein n=1 Tax=Streptomyces sp. NPDC056007 TaxID=3345678 RepID=UPI0018438F99|nr:hypothetical protein [Streptomyces sp. SJ1-7]